MAHHKRQVTILQHTNGIFGFEWNEMIRVPWRLNM